MNTLTLKSLSAVAAVILLAGCAAEPQKNPDVAGVRAELTALQSNPDLAPRAPLAIRQADDAVKAAEIPTTDMAQSNHLVYMAEKQVGIAKAQAEQRYAEDQAKVLNDQRSQVVIDARTAQVDSAQAQNARLQQEIADLKAKKTDRGLVFTLGDVLFETGKSDLKEGAKANVDKLVDVLKQYQDRGVAIEGYTDSTGSLAFNMQLSQARADTVKAYLMQNGISSTRVTSVGKGPELPVASNGNAAGRQLNRRVEVVVSNPTPTPG